MINDKEFQKCLEENIKKEDFANFNLSHEDMIKVLTDGKGYIREKLSVTGNKLTETVKPIKVDENLVREIAQEIKIENLLERHGWELIK